MKPPALQWTRTDLTAPTSEACKKKPLKDRMTTAWEEYQTTLRACLSRAERDEATMIFGARAAKFTEEAIAAVDGMREERGET